MAIERTPEWEAALAAFLASPDATDGDAKTSRVPVTIEVEMIDLVTMVYALGAVVSSGMIPNPSAVPLFVDLSERLTDIVFKMDDE